MKTGKFIKSAKVSNSTEACFYIIYRTKFLVQKIFKTAIKRSEQSLLVELKTGVGSLSGGQRKNYP